jgi:group I intron endonuclease
MNSGIYKITCTHTGDFYIGSTSSFTNRWKAHRYQIRHKLKKGNWVPLLTEYTENDFSFAILEKCNVDQLIDKEQEYIDTLQPTLNISKSAYNPSLDPNVVKGRPFGDKHADALLSNDEYIEIFLWYYNNPDKKALDASAHFAKATTKMLQSIYGLQKHTWISELYPKEYSEMLARVAGRKSSKFKTRSIQSPKGVVYEFTNMSAFCREYNLSQPKISEVCSGKRRQYKGWTNPKIIGKQDEE